MGLVTRTTADDWQGVFDANSGAGPPTPVCVRDATLNKIVSEKLAPHFTTTGCVY